MKYTRFDMAFIKFTETGRSFTAKASISTSGMISFNDGARRKYRMDEYEYCILYFDQQEKCIGVELTNDKVADGVMKLRKRNTGADIGAKSFLGYFDIAPDTTTMYETRTGEEDNWIIIDLKTGRKRKSKSES